MGEKREAWDMSMHSLFEADPEEFESFGGGPLLQGRDPRARFWVC